MKTTTKSLALLAAHVALWSNASVATVKTVSVDPRLGSWMRNTDELAVIRDPDDLVYKTTWEDPASGTVVSDAPADVQAVYYDDDYVYIATEGLASHVMGPWYGPDGRDFPNFPLDLGLTAVIPRFVLALPFKTTTPAAAIGVWVNGTAVFNMINREFGTPGVPYTYYWHPDAYVVESMTFDPANYHSEGNGWYHAHVNPVALRWQLDDHVQGWLTRTLASGLSIRYTEVTQPATVHSPILGWAFDGIPIYGPYGFSNPTNASSGVTRMRSGYVLRDGSHGTDNLVGRPRKSLPRWAALAAGLTSLYSLWPSSTYALDTAYEGPKAEGDYPLGYYIEDYQYRGDVAGGGTKGVDWDLDRYNCRWCVTPEFPNGTYAYFATIQDANGTPAFPYTVGRQYFGAVFGDIGWGADAPEIPAGVTRYTGPFGPDASVGVSGSVPTLP